MEHTQGSETIPASDLDQVVDLDIGVVPEAAIPDPRLLQSEEKTVLTFQGMRRRADGRHENAGAVVMEFKHCIITKFGYPNDEALDGHPLSARGLSSYAVFEVRNSSWIAQLERQNRVCFPTFQPRYGRHFIITFHDSTFECIAEDFMVECR